MSAYVYGFRDAAGAWLYIGSTEYFSERLYCHRRAQPWWSDVARAAILVGPTDLGTARRIERHLIETREPVHNTVFTLAWRQRFARDGEPFPLTELSPAERSVLARGWVAPWYQRDKVRRFVTRMLTTPVKRRAVAA